MEGSSFKSTLSTLDSEERNLPDANEAAENFEERIIIYTLSLKSK
jgi:hypothetical protein